MTGSGPAKLPTLKYRFAPENFPKHFPELAAAKKPAALEAVFACPELRKALEESPESLRLGLYSAIGSGSLESVEVIVAHAPHHIVDHSTLAMGAERARNSGEPEIRAYLSNRDRYLKVMPTSLTVGSPLAAVA